MLPACNVDAIFVGAVAVLADDSRSSAIVKTAVTGAVQLSEEGLAGDTHADLQAHGGPDKALHLFPAEHYARLLAAFPAARNLLPGGLGENITTRGLTEETVCIGDIFALGATRIQVTQPRTPCWKIDRRTGCKGVAAYIAEHGCTGWHYRVLTSGAICAGDSLVHLERPAGSVPLARFWRTVRSPHPLPAALAMLAAAPGLSPEWVRKLQERIERLTRNED
ncbi:MAG: MOSC domain-containing protein [Gammaproteobacteria bacterium]|nr:MOSC domain-containing protein [Rhodocyclaceae bacterium]MBU3908359.1 MOSC domain-containing protein [Gammaproteobacteria bacterium]MBU3987868.1 MOSC domain-containing protein [Gammaproteobacteria bacterium]MBU4004069.1 MOSC domain-containing protein [Gammaproteobacteria bacterium]MBU4020316.1 MOSC domain-containing protein [Gammaproteobacteria bacterium]